MHHHQQGAGSGWFTLNGRGQNSRVVWTMADWSTCVAFDVHGMVRLQISGYLPMSSLSLLATLGPFWSTPLPKTWDKQQWQQQQQQRIKCATCPCPSLTHSLQSTLNIALWFCVIILISQCSFSFFSFLFFLFPPSLLPYSRPSRSLAIPSAPHFSSLLPISPIQSSFLNPLFTLPHQSSDTTPHPSLSFSA